MSDDATKKPQLGVAAIMMEEGGTEEAIRQLAKGHDDLAHPGRQLIYIVVCSLWIDPQTGKHNWITTNGQTPHNKVPTQIMLKGASDALLRTARLLDDGFTPGEPSN